MPKLFSPSVRNNFNFESYLQQKLTELIQAHAHHVLLHLQQDSGPIGHMEIAEHYNSQVTLLSLNRGRKKITATVIRAAIDCNLHFWHAMVSPETYEPFDPDSEHSMVIDTALAYQYCPLHPRNVMHSFTIPLAKLLTQRFTQVLSNISHNDQRHLADFLVMLTFETFNKLPTNLAAKLTKSIGSEAYQQALAEFATHLLNIAVNHPEEKIHYNQQRTPLYWVLTQTASVHDTNPQASPHEGYIP